MSNYLKKEKGIAVALNNQIVPAVTLGGLLNLNNLTIQF